MSTNPDPDLMRIFDFTPADLEANRASRISDRQAQRFQTLFAQQAAYANKNRIVAFILCVAFAAFIGVAFGSNAASLMGNLILFLLIALGVIGFWGYLIQQQARHAAADLRSGVVAVVVGTLMRLSDRQGGSVYVYPSKIGLRISHSEDDQLKAYLKQVPQNTVFHVYYTSNTKRILSMEIVAT